MSPSPVLIDLWEPQIPWIEELKQASREGHMHILGQAPTGFGKTTCFCRVVAGTEEHGTRTVILAHRNKLIEQISERLRGFGIEHGLIAEGEPFEPWKRVQLGTIGRYTNKAKKGEVKPPDFIIFDEGHHIAADSFDWIYDFAAKNNAHSLVVTATSNRPDGKPLSKRITKLVHGPQPSYLMETINPATGRTYLVPPICYGPPDDIDMSGVEIDPETGDHKPGQLAKATMQSSIIDSATRLYKEHNPGKSLFFAVNVEHAIKAAKEFNEAGIPCEALYGKLSKAEQAAIFARFASGVTKVISSCDMLSEGVDLPDVSAIFLGRKTQSIIMFLQAIGRGLRSAPGKAFCYVFDMVGNIDIHGMPEDDRIWTLEGTTRLSTSELKQCGKCYRWFKSTASVCSECREPVGESAGTKKRSLQADETKRLALITEEIKREKLIKKQLEELRQKSIKERKSAAKTLADFQKIAIDEGYAMGWAVIQYQMFMRRRRGSRK